MRLIIILLMILPIQASAFSFATGGCATNGCETGDQLLASNMGEIDTALDSIESTNSTQTSDISSIQTNYLAKSGGTMAGNLDIGSGVQLTVSSGGQIVVGPGASLGAIGGGSVLATAMSATGQIDDNDLAAGAVDGGTGGEIADGSITAADISDGSVTGTDLLDDTVALTTDTSGNYVATVTGDTEITVSGAGTEGRAVTLAIAAAMTRDTELDAKSAATSTSGNVPKFSGTTGDLVDTGVAVDGSNNITTAGAISVGGSTGASTFTMRNMADSGWVECGVNVTTFSCATDADGVPDGTL